MKNPTDSIGNRNRDLPACSAVPQTTAPPRTPPIVVIIVKLKRVRGTDNIAPMLNFEEHSCKLSNSKSTPFYTYWLNKLDIICWNWHVIWNCVLCIQAVLSDYICSWKNARLSETSSSGLCSAICSMLLARVMFLDIGHNILQSLLATKQFINGRVLQHRVKCYI
jgi:hypothetical protein